MWIFETKQINTIQDIPENTVGFIYHILNLDNGKEYIGKKSIYSQRKVNLTKKEIELLENKRLKKWKILKKESDWIEYNSSCKPLIQDIKAGARVVKTILKFCYSKTQLTYEETKQLFINNVLEDENYYNENILNRFWKGHIT